MLPGAPLWSADAGHWPALSLPGAAVLRPVPLRSPRAAAQTEQGRAGHDSSTGSAAATGSGIREVARASGPAFAGGPQASPRAA